MKDSCTGAVCETGGCVPLAGRTPEKRCIENINRRKKDKIHSILWVYIDALSLCNNYICCRFQITARLITGITGIVICFINLTYSVKNTAENNSHNIILKLRIISL